MTRAVLRPPACTAASWFHSNGINVFPVHARGKAPAVPSWDDYQCSASDAAKLVDYAVALGPLGVCDTDDDGAEAWAQQHLPATPLIVRTARGVHRYYRLIRTADVPHFFHRAGMTIEFRHAGQYVIGPGSTHKTGFVYTADDWSWDMKDVPFFPIDAFPWDDRPAGERGSATGGGDAYQLPDKIYAGERHDQIFRMMRSMRMRGVPLEGCLAACRIENDLHCDPPLPWGTTARFLTRTFKHADRAGYRKWPLTAFGVFCALVENGFSRNAAIAAAQAVDARFDPENPPQDLTLSYAEPIPVLPDRDIYGRTYDQVQWYRDGNRFYPLAEDCVLTNGQWTLRRKKA